MPLIPSAAFDFFRFKMPVSSFVVPHVVGTTPQRKRVATACRKEALPLLWPIFRPPPQNPELPAKDVLCFLLLEPHSQSEAFQTPIDISAPLEPPAEASHLPRLVSPVEH